MVCTYSVSPWDDLELNVSHWLQREISNVLDIFLVSILKNNFNVRKYNVIKKKQHLNNVCIYSQTRMTMIACFVV